MTRKNVPKNVNEFLIKVAEVLKEFNKKSKFEIISNSNDEFFLYFFPINYSSLYFGIDNFELTKLDSKSLFETPYYNIEINYDSVVAIKNTFKGVNSNPFSGKVSSSYFFEVLDQYLITLPELVDKISKSEKTEIDLKELFNFENNSSLLHNSENKFDSSDNILPICLKQLSVTDFQGVYELKINSIPIDSQWLFLVGENGFGKTTILQSTFLGLNGAFDGNFNLLDSKKSNIQVEYKSKEESYLNNATENKKPLIHLAAYGPGRLNLQGPASENAEDRNSSVSYNLFNSDGFLFNINAELVKWALKKDERFNLIKKAFCTLIPNLADIRFNKATDQIEYIEKEIGFLNDEQIIYQPLPFQKLASGFKSIIALAGDILIRLSKNQKDVKDPSDLIGIVLIDEIDLHLHPKLQKQLIGSFSKVFPKIQFIVSTHSPIPLLGAPENSMIYKVTRNKIEGVQIEEIKIDLKNLTPNLVLTSGIFDMEDFISVQNEDITEVRTEDSFEEMRHNDEVEKYLKDFEKSNQNFPDELFVPKSK